MDWKKIYEKTLKNLCETDEKEFGNIVEIEEPDYSVELVENQNAKENSLYSFKLDDGATDDDYKKFVEYIYGYIGEDVNDYIPIEDAEESEDNEMDEKKIRTLLKRYGAEDVEIDNFMEDLANYKEDATDEDDDFNYLDNETMTKLKATEEGKDLIMNAPKMAKDELKKAIMDYLSK